MRAGLNESLWDLSNNASNIDLDVRIWFDIDSTSCRISKFDVIVIRIAILNKDVETKRWDCEFDRVRICQSQ